MYDAPPPYSGIYPNQAKDHTSQVTNGFYNPNNLKEIYAPSNAPEV